MRLLSGGGGGGGDFGIDEINLFRSLVGKRDCKSIVAKI